MEKSNDLDMWIGIFLLGIFVVCFFIFEPSLIIISIPLTIVAYTIFISGSEKRDEYYTSKKILFWTIVAIQFFIFCFYFLIKQEFEQFVFYKDKYVFIGFLFAIISLFFVWFNKKIIPISFIEDDDRIVQETMYEDYDYKDLGEAFLYRGSKFKDENGKIITANNLNEATGTLTPIELDILELEMVATNKKDELKFYYEKLIYDFYRVFTKDTNLKTLKNQSLLKTYGYNFTFIECEDLEQFKEILKTQSIFFQKLFYFLEKDMLSSEINISVNIKNIVDDNNKCLELVLITVFLLVRQFMNFPTGDLAKYITCQKDYQFFGALSSLPSDYVDINSTSVGPSGIAYYYIFYKIHLNNFQIKNEKEIFNRWLIIN